MLKIARTLTSNKKRNTLYIVSLATNNDQSRKASASEKEEERRIFFSLLFAKCSMFYFTATVWRVQYYISDIQILLEVSLYKFVVGSEA